MDPALRQQVADNARACDKGELPARYVLPLLGQAGLIDAPYRASAQALRELASEDLSAGFTAWGARMTFEYLKRAGTPYAREIAAKIASGEHPGVTAMAGAFKEAAGVGELDLTASRDGSGYVVNGKIGWASNLYADAVVVTGAKTADGEKFLFAFEAGQDGVEFGQPFALLGLGSTESAWVSFTDVRVSARQVLTTDFDAFMKGVRPVFVVMQIAECLGVAEASATAAGQQLDGMKAVFSDDVEQVKADIVSVTERWTATISALESGEVVDPESLLVLRLDAANAAVKAANIEVRVAGGAGYAKSTPASRRYREASFLPVQSPSEAQLRYELERVREGK